MAKNSNEYWAERARKDKIKVIKTGEQGIDNLKRILKTNLDDVQRQIKEFYEKYGDNPAEKLSYSEFEKYKKNLKKKAEKYPNDETLQKIAKQDIPKYKIDRLRALETDLQILLTEATAGQEAGIYKTLNDVGKVAQATLAKRFVDSLGLEFNTIASRKMKQLMSSDWSGMNWSDRLWKDRKEVGEKLTKILEKGIPQGTSLQKMSRELKQVTGQSFNNAFRLIRTETSHIDGQVTLEGYRQAGAELGLEYYEYDAFLDSRTSTICRELDKKRFRIDEAEVGVNYPPAHPNCRSTTQLVLDEDYKPKDEKVVNDIKENKEETPVLVEKGEQKQGSKIPDKPQPIKQKPEFNPMSDIVLEQSREQVANLNKKEKSAIKKYTGEDYYTWINKYLRGENKNIPYEQRIVMENLTSALNQCSLPENVELYRNVSPKFIETIFNKSTADLIRKGAEKDLTEKQFESLQEKLLHKNFVEKGFCSTSYKPNSYEKDSPILLKIKAPKGTKGAVIDNLSRFKKEKECLLSPNQNFVIQNLKYNNRQLEIEVEIK